MRLIIASLLLSLFSFSNAQYGNTSVFVYHGEGGTQFSWAMQADRQAGDVFFHMSAPSGNSWVGVGFGNKMAHSLMFIAYEDSTGGLTLSPRYAAGHEEPTYQSYINVGHISEKNDKTMEVSAVCHNCFLWKDSGLDLENSQQPFIFAVGPPHSPVKSDDPSASLTEHMFVGHFTMDMKAATVDYGGNFPQGPFYNSVNAGPATDTMITTEPEPKIHGFLMAITFVLILPIGSLLLRAWNKVKAHAVVQIFATLLFIIAFAWGVVVSKKYNRSKDFNTAHQVIGILIFLAILSQAMLGILHHRIYNEQKKKTIFGWIHIYMGPAIILIGLINGGLGISLADKSSSLALPYVITIVIVAAIYTAIRVYCWRRKKQNDAYNKEVAGIAPARTKSQRQRPRFGRPSQRPPQPPPDYTEGRGQWRAPQGQNVPLEKFDGKQGDVTSVSQV